MKKLLAAAAVAALALTGCASGGNTESTSDDNTFVVGMECAYAPLTGKQVLKQILQFL